MGAGEPLNTSKPRQAEWEAFVARSRKTPYNATADEKLQLMEPIDQLDIYQL